MGGFFKKHQSLLVISSLLVLTLFLLLSNLRKKTSLSHFERAAVAIVAPFQDIVGWSAAKVSLIWDDYMFLVNVKKKNRLLQQNVERLAFENALLTEQFKHYERLDSMLSFPKLFMIPFEVARVIGRDTTGKVMLLTLNKGSSDGLAENMPVITHRGLVGRVVRVSSAASKVLMITDVRSAVDCIVQETRDSLLVSGANSLTLDVLYLSIESKVKEGDRIISSGLGGVFPKGLLVGVLTDVKTSGDSLFLTARLAPSADLNKVEEVLVLKSAFPTTITQDDWP